MSTQTRQYLVTFCNQLASVRHSVCVLDLKDNALAWVNVDKCVVTRDFGGFCGSCLVGGQVVLCTQSSIEPMLAVLPAGGHEIEVTHQLEGVRDPHSIIHHDGHIYVCSTGTNEIYRIGYDGRAFQKPDVFWRYPEVDYGRDEVHLNGLTVLDNRFVASCFGARKTDSSWDRKGRVFFLDSGQSIRGGLDQPHSPVALGNRLYFAESGAKKIHVYDQKSDDAWAEKTEIELTGYVRGLAPRGDALMAGVSAVRSVSRSKKTPTRSGGDRTKAAIVRIDLKTGEAGDAFDMSPFASEIYDIVPLPGRQLVDSPFPALSARVEEMEETTDRHNMDMQTVNATAADLRADLAHRDEELAATKTQAKALQQRVGGLQGHVDTLQVDLAHRNEELAATKTQAKALQQRVEALQGHIDILQADLAHRDEELAATKTQAKALQGHVGSLQADLTKRQAELEGQRTHVDDLYAELQAIKLSLLWRMGNPVQMRWRKLRHLIARAREKKS